MRKTIILLSVLSFVSFQGAHAQSTFKVNGSKAKVRPRGAMTPKKPAPTIVTPVTTPTNTSAVEVVAPTGATFHATYTGVMEGPVLDGSSEKVSLSNRIGARIDWNETFDTGIQARVNTSFTNSGVTAANENWRLFADIKNIYRDDLFSFQLTPRIVLPTSNGAQTASMIVAPELIASLNIIPSDSRFTIGISAQFARYFYSNQSAALSAADGKGATDYALNNTIEASYTLNPSFDIVMSLNPTLSSTVKNSFSVSSDELDLGVNWNFMKGWSLNPYIGAELNDINSSNITSKLQAYMTVSGTFL